MFLSILHHQSGSEFLRRLAPNETLDVHQHVKKWLETEYGDELNVIFSEPGSYIPNGGGEYTVEIRHTKKVSGVCWTCEDFFTRFNDVQED